MKILRNFKDITTRVTVVHYVELTFHGTQVLRLKRYRNNLNHKVVFTWVELKFLDKTVYLRTKKKIVRSNYVLFFKALYHSQN